MKTWKFLGAPLMLMLLTGMSWCCVSATDETTEPVSVKSGQNISVGDVTVKENSNAVTVEASGEKDASVKVNGNVSLQNESGGTAVYAEGDTAKASAEVTGDVSVTTAGEACGIDAEGDYSNEKGTAEVKVGNNVSAAGQTYAYGMYVYNADVNVGNSVKSEGPMAVGVDTSINKKGKIDVGGNVSATGANAAGVILDSYGCGVTADGVTLNVGGDVTAIGNKSDVESEYEWPATAQGIYLCNCSGKVKADIKGNVEATSDDGEAMGIYVNDYRNYGSDRSFIGDHSILVHKNLKSSGVGICFEEAAQTPKKVNILVEDTLDAKDVGVLLRKSPYGVEDQEDGSNSVSNLNLTVWKIVPNENGNVAEQSYTTPMLGGPRSTSLNSSDSHHTLKDLFQKSYGATKNRPVTRGEESGRETATDFEKKIMYIIKVEQPGAGGTIKATDANGNDLAKSFDFDVAHEGETVLLKASLEDGYKLVAAYNGLGEKQALLQDENGNYYIVVPKGGGVYLSVELEDTTEHYQADNDDDIESITDDTAEETEAEGNDNTEPVSASSTTSKSGSEALKTGDVSQVAPWLMLSLVSAGGIAGLEISNKKNKLEK